MRLWASRRSLATVTFPGFHILAVLVGELADEHLEAVAEVVFHGVHGGRPGDVVVGSVGVLFGIFVFAQEQCHGFAEGGRAMRVEWIGNQAGEDDRTAYG